MTNYARGTAVERKAIELLVRRGYSKKYTQRTAGSHSCLDVIAIDPESKRILVAQCKRSKTGRFPKISLPRDGSYLVEFRTLNWQDGKGFVLECDGDGNAIDETP